jgi:uncharacterized protein (DUF934 family)
MVIIDGHSIADHWRHLDDPDELPDSGAVTVSKARWQAERDALATRREPVGLRLEADSSLKDIAEDLNRFPVIVLDFASLADGRLFSLARMLRERYRFSGELRARGNFIQDQIFFLSRVGVNAFEPAAEMTVEGVLAALSTFSVTYQAATDQPLPLYRRERRPSPCGD